MTKNKSRAIRESYASCTETRTQQKGFCLSSLSMSYKAYFNKITKEPHRMIVKPLD